MSSTDAGRGSPRVRLLNAWIDDLTCDELPQRLDAGTVFTLNLDHLYLLQRDRDFQAAYAGADFVTADSHYVWKALGWLGRGIREKISGSDLAPRYCQHHRANDAVRVFLLGAGPGVAALARERINARAGREVVVGAHSPSMRIADDETEIAAVAELVNASGATTLIVGLGSPKQEIWLHRHRHRMPGVRVFMGVGATLDYEAGEVERSPRWMSDAGLEWLHRLVTRPGRYARRYARDLEFFWLLLLDAAGRQGTAARFAVAMNAAGSATGISARDPDWSRERKRFFEWAPSRSLLASLRAYQRHRGSRAPHRVALRMLATLRHRAWSIVTGADIPLNAQIGGGLLIPHPNGIVVHPDARIGPNCLVFQQVTIGDRDGGVPTIGGHVDIGAGAKVLGRVTIGDHARIGANAVVLGDLPADCGAVGIPARVVRSA